MWPPRHTGRYFDFGPAGGRVNNKETTKINKRSQGHLPGMWSRQKNEKAFNLRVSIIVSECAIAISYRCIELTYLADHNYRYLDHGPGDHLNLERSANRFKTPATTPYRRPPNTQMLPRPLSNPISINHNVHSIGQCTIKTKCRYC